jgi:hypothetical protein
MSIKRQLVPACPCSSAPLDLCISWRMWSASRSGRFTPRKVYLLSADWEVKWDPDPVWTTFRCEISGFYRDSNSDPCVIHRVVSRCSDRFPDSQQLHNVCKLNDRLCALVARVPGYRSRGLGFDFPLYQTF